MLFAKEYGIYEKVFTILKIANQERQLFEKIMFNEKLKERIELLNSMQNIFKNCVGEN